MPCGSLHGRKWPKWHPAADNASKTPEENFRGFTVTPLSKGRLALLLLVLRILTDNHNAAFPLDDLALFANRLDRRSNFHLRILL